MSLPGQPRGKCRERHVNADPGKMREEVLREIKVFTTESQASVEYEAGLDFNKRCRAAGSASQKRGSDRGRRPCLWAAVSQRRL